jgi:cytidylate kinase
MSDVSLDLSDVIAIDGGAGTGKSFIGMNVAKRLGLPFLDTGVIYRIAVYIALQKGIRPEDGETIADALLAEKIEFKIAGEYYDMYQIVLMNGVDITHELFDEAASQMASVVARHQTVRIAASEQYRRVLTGERTIVVGRDTGTNVLPNARLKIFVKADPFIVAARRIKQRNLPESELENLVEDIKRRDARDAHVLTPAQDAVILENNGDAEEILSRIISLYNERFTPLPSAAQAHGFSAQASGQI